MGMTCSLHRLSSVEIDALIRNPDEMTRVLGLDDGLLGFLLRLTQITISEVDPAQTTTHFSGCWTATKSFALS
jgi:hypothetical protein